MVTIETIEIDQQPFLGITIKLPGLTTRLVYSTQGILFDECWNSETLCRRTATPFCIGTGRRLEALLNRPIQFVSPTAQQCGIDVGMAGKQAILRMKRES